MSVLILLPTKKKLTSSLSEKQNFGMVEVSCGSGSKLGMSIMLWVTNGHHQIPGSCITCGSLQLQFILNYNAFIEG